MRQTHPGPDEPQQGVRPPRARDRTGETVMDYLTTTDHKKIGHLHLVTSFAFFLAAGVMALLMRAELAPTPEGAGRRLKGRAVARRRIDPEISIKRA